MNQHYFSSEPASDLRPRELEVVLAGAPRTVSTAGGVFSPEHIDRGTEVLLHTLANEDQVAPGGAILDLGCGWGPIALDAALSHPEHDVWAVDVNERARELTARNAARLGLERLRVADPSAVPAEVRFASIRSNPPIRVGKEALHEMLTHWLPRLEAGGRAHLVVAKHLGADSLQRWIATKFPAFEVERVSRHKGFHVIEVRA